MNSLNEMFLLAPHQNTLAHLIHTGAKQHSKAVWHKRTFARVNYAIADAFSDDIAAFLISAGCRPGHYFYMLNPQTYEQSIALFGAIKVGMVVIEPPVADFDLDQLLSAYTPYPVTFQHNQFRIGNTATSFKKALSLGAGTLFFIPHIYKNANAVLRFSLNGHGAVKQEVLQNQEAVGLIQCPDSKSRLTPTMRLIDRWCAGEVGFG
jgi:hypothetical protein